MVEQNTPRRTPRAIRGHNVRVNVKSTKTKRLASARSVIDTARWNRRMPKSMPASSIRLISRPWLESVHAALLGQELQADAGARYTVPLPFESENIGNRC